MIVKLKRTNYRVFAFDIESHNSTENMLTFETKMWLGCLIDDSSNWKDKDIYFNNMNDVLTRLKELSTPKRKHNEKKKPCKNILVYIYNLSFEWSFILPKLLELGFEFKEGIEQDDELVYSSVSTKSCSSVYQAMLKFNKESGFVILKDLAKIYGGGLSKVAKAFNLPTQKGSIAYKLNRNRPKKEGLMYEWYYKRLLNEKCEFKGVELHTKICNDLNIPLKSDFEYHATIEEKLYCFKDVRIIIDILLIMQEKGDKEFFNVISMASYSMKKLLKRGFKDNLKPYTKYRELYPQLSLEENNFLRRGVEGGICYCAPRYQFIEINEKVGHIDAHQMHPTQMYFRRFPYGEGTYHTGEPNFMNGKIQACHIKVSYTGVYLHSIIKLISLDLVDDFDLVVWSFEIPTMKKCYRDLEIEFIDYYEYEARLLPFRNYVKDNYNERLKARAEHNDFNVLYYKLLNNSAYGKFLERPHNETFKNVLNELGIIDSIVIEKDVKEVNARYTYLPIGSCIPAYSRVQLIETALKFGWENICYFDTDSIFFILNPKTRYILSTLDTRDFLGGWSYEETIIKAQFVAPKAYKLINDKGEHVVKSGGFNFDNYIKEQHKDNPFFNVDEYQVQYEDIDLIKGKYLVNRAYRCIGGTIIDYQLKERKINDKYLDIYNKNMIK